MIRIENLPSVNAGFNALTTVLLLAGYTMIRRNNVAAHRFCMVAALTSSTFFLIGYLTYHSYAGTTRFTGEGLLRSVYFAILVSHTILAAAIIPLVLVTVFRALKGRFDRHKAIARWTLPIWLYVSVTGVVVYFMLYRL
jgi:putative membrane protein